MTDHATPEVRPTSEIQEVPPAPAPTQPVARSGATTGGTARARGRWRWPIAIVVVALLVTSTVAGAVLLTGARDASAVAGWAPTDALVYGELRADLPGDQRDKLAAFLSAFPGFSDRSLLERKLAEVYDRLLSSATKGKQTYSADIAPWFGGQLGVALRAPADLTGTSGRRMPPVLMIATATDATKALAWFRTTAEQAGATVTASGSGGTELLLAAADGETIAAAAPAGVLLVGDEASVRAALERNGANGLASDAGFRAAMAALDHDSLATAYVHVAGYADLLGRLAIPSSLPEPPKDLLALLPAWSAGSLRAESDALVVDGSTPGTLAGVSVTDGASRLPARLPASTIGLAEAHDLGKAILGAIASAPNGATRQVDIDKALQPVGGLHGLVGWVGEAGAVVLKVDDRALPGAVAIPADAEAARTLARELRNLATVAGLAPRDEAYAGTTITTIDLSGLARSLRALGTQDLPAGSPTERLSVSWAITDGVVAVGLDPAFVKAVLDTRPGSSLADVAGFRSALDRAGATHHKLVWVDVAAVRDLLVAGMPAAEKTKYQTDVAPYVAPLGVVVGVATRDGDLQRSHGLLILDTP